MLSCKTESSVAIGLFLILTSMVHAQIRPATITATVRDAAGATVGVPHPHTGTCVETRDETYAVMQAVDRRYVKFDRDIGQLQKDRSDPMKVEDFQSVCPPPESSFKCTWRIMFR